MNKDELKTILDQHRLWLDDNGGKRADLRGADMKYSDLKYAELERADLRGADMKYSDMQHADMRGAELQGADMKYSDMQHADMQGADLKYSDLKYAALRGADMKRADLQGAALKDADLKYADIDYACLPLWCGSKGMIVDRRIAAQIAAHFCSLVCDDEDYQAARTAILEFARTSHRAVDLGLVEERESGGGKTCETSVEDLFDVEVTK